MVSISPSISPVFSSKQSTALITQQCSDEFATYVGDNLIQQKSGYMLSTTAALRLVPGAKPQPLHRVSLERTGEKCR